MIKRRSIYSAIIKVLLCATQLQAGKQIVSRNSSPNLVQSSFKNKPAGDFFEQFKQAFQEAKEVLLQIKNFAFSFGSFLQQADYFLSTNINAIKQDSKTQNKPIGLIIDFGYAGVGPLDRGFQGVLITPVVETVPSQFKKFFQAALQLSCKELFSGTFVKDPLTQKRELRSSPFVEFFFKAVLLAHGKTKKTIDKNDFNAQLFMLVNRLSQTQGFKTADDIVRSLPGIFKSLLNVVKIQGKSLQDFLKSYLLIFQEIKNYDFSRLDVSPLKKKDMGKFVKILCAIFLRGATDYAQAKADFLKTPEGKAFYQSNKELPEAKRVALLHQQVPACQLIKDEMQERVLALVQRLTIYKKIRGALKKKLRPMFDPLLNLFGMSLDLLLADDDEIGPADEVSYQEVDNLLVSDALFGDVAIDVQEVALPQDALPLEQATNVEEDSEEFLEGPHPIDLMDGVMDEFDKLDLLGPIEPSKERHLIDRLMKAMMQALEEYETYDLSDFTDLGYALLDAQSYVDTTGDRKKLQDFFLIVSRDLVVQGVTIQQ